MSVLDRRTASDATKLLVFVLVTTLATMMLVITIGNVSFGDKLEYRAEFTDATGVVKGDDIRIAGVKVGVVEDVEIVKETRALVSFTVDADTTVTSSSEVAIRYRNLVGQRYLAITQGLGEADRLQEGRTIPVERTRPALDLTVLFNGFKPLFAALSPSDVNQLSYEIVQVFQGESGTLEGLLDRTASLTSTLASRDRVIGDLIENLNTVLVHVGDRDEQLSRLILGFRRLVKGFKDDRQEILGSLEDISQLAVETASLVAGIRPAFVKDIEELRVVARNLDRNRAELDRAIQVLPVKLTKIGRTAVYGSWFNFYLCEFKGNVVLPGGENLPVTYEPGSDRCDLG